MVGTIWLTVRGIVMVLIAISPAAIVFAANRASARNGRVSRGFLFGSLLVLLLLGFVVLVGAVHDERVQWAIVGVFWFGFLALWPAGIIRFARKTRGTPYARVAREALLVWLIFLALSVVFILPGGVEAWLTTAARFFVNEGTARRIGKAGFFGVWLSAFGLYWFHFIRRGYVLRAAFMRPPKADARELQRRVEELRDKPPGAKLRLLLATAVALLMAGTGFYSSWDQARTMAYWEEHHRKQYEHWFRESVRWGFPEVLSLYLERGVDINAADDDGYTALHIAADEGHANVAEFLLANGAAVNARTNDRYTPLHFAVMEGHRDVVEDLLSHGAEVNPRDWEGKTPLRLALDKGHNEIAQLVREHGGTE